MSAITIASAAGESRPSTWRLTSVYVPYRSGLHGDERRRESDAGGLTPSADCTATTVDVLTLG